MVKKTMRQKKINKKTKKGGFLFSKKVVPEICTNTNLDELNTSVDLHARYQACCPKNFLGFKNSSPLCKNLDTKFQQVIKEENSPRDSEEEDTDVPPPVLPPYMSPKPKPWYKFWGGKKTRKNRGKSRKGKTNKMRKHKK